MIRSRWLVAAVVCAATIGCGPGRADFAHHTVGEFEHAVDSGGLTVCSAKTNTGGLANQAVSTRVLTVAVDCNRPRVSVLVDRFANQGDRDAAARNFEVLSRPRSDGVVWTWGPFTVFAFGARDDTVMDKLTDLLHGLGAK